MVALFGASGAPTSCRRDVVVWLPELGALRFGDAVERLAGLPYTIGEMRYGVRHELAYTLADLMLRRTHVAFETRDHGTQSAERVARGVAELLGWSARDIAAAIEEYAREVKRVFAIDIH